MIEPLFILGFLGSDEAVVIAVPFAEFLDVEPAFAPFVQGDLAILINVELHEPIGQVLGQLAGAEDRGPNVEVFLLEDDGDWINLLIGAAAPVLHAGREEGLVFIQVDQVVAVGVPLGELGPQLVGHFVLVEEAVAIAVEAIEIGFGPLGQAIDGVLRRRRLEAARSLKTARSRKATRTLETAPAGKAAGATHHACFHFVVESDEQFARDLSAGDASFEQELIEWTAQAIGIGNKEIWATAGEGVEHLVGIARPLEAAEAAFASALPARGVGLQKQDGQGQRNQHKGDTVTHD